MEMSDRKGKPLAKKEGYWGLRKLILASAVFMLKVESIGQYTVYIYCPFL